MAEKDTIEITSEKGKLIVKSSESKSGFNLINTIVLGALLGYCIWSFLGNKKMPTYNSKQVETISQEWIQDMNKIGLNGNSLIKRVDKIMVVDEIPVGFLNQERTVDIMGRSDLGSRTIWILNRPMKKGQLKALIYHELGHYVFNLKHEGSGDIMSTYIKEDKGYYKKNWDNLLPKYLDKCRRAR